MTIEELALAQGAVPVLDPHELAADIWESDEELDAILADLRLARGLLSFRRTVPPLGWTARSSVGGFG